MAKINLNNVTNPSNVSVMNDNFQKVAKALNEKVLYRDNVPGEPNQMESPLDMNGERLYNLPAPVQDNEAARLQDVKDALAGGPYEKSLRVLDENIPAIPDKAFRANKVLSFDAHGKPTVLIPTHDSSTQLRIDLADGSLGASLVGWVRNAIGAVRRTLSEKASDVINVKDFGAALDNVTDDLPALNRAIAHLRTLGGGTLDFGSSGMNNCRISAPWRLCSNLTIRGDVRILPTANFSSAGVVFPTYSTEVPQVYSCLAYFNDGTHADSPLNFGYSGLVIEDTVVFDGQYHVQADNGLIIEGITDYQIKAGFTQFLQLGLWVKYYCWGGAISSYITSCRTALLKLGPASNGINLNGLRVYGMADDPDYGLIVDGDNNGIDLSGAFVEKVKNQILWIGGSGPSTLSGVDFEVCSGTAIHIDGTGTIGRPAGPIVITGSFLEAGVNTVKATNAIVLVEGCRIRSTPLAFKAIGQLARIYDRGNVIESSVVKHSEGNVISDLVEASRRSLVNKLPYTDIPYQVGYSIDNRTYGINEELSVSGLTFDSSMQDISIQRMLSSSTWKTNEMRNGSVFGSLGMVLNYKTGSKNVEPLEHNTHSLGTPSKSWHTIYGRTIIFNSGVGVGVGPSNIGELVLQFTSNGVVTIKGMGTDGIVRTADIPIVP